MLSIYHYNDNFINGNDKNPYVSNPSVTTICGTKALMSGLGDVSTETPAVTKC